VPQPERNQNSWHGGVLGPSTSPAADAPTGRASAGSNGRTGWRTRPTLPADPITTST
jgi:hypothetical protein